MPPVSRSILCPGRKMLKLANVGADAEKRLRLPVETNIAEGKSKASICDITDSIKTGLRLNIWWKIEVFTHHAGYGSVLFMRVTGLSQEMGRIRALTGST